MKFSELGLSPRLLQAIEKLGIIEPTKIQKISIPHIVAGKDVIGESATGSGKTIAFGTAIAERVEAGKGLQALVLAPTRELAEQVKGALRQIAKLRIISVYGGVSINPQIDALRTADVVVATPGRLLDHMSRRTVNLSKVKILVLDEADRMFDMGFFDDVEQIIRACPRERQSLFFSATISTRITELAGRYMRQPIEVSATKQVDPSKLKQIYYDIDKHRKLSLLVHLLKENKGLSMVFCNTRRSTDIVVNNLKANSVKAVAIHGGLTQNKRSKMLEMFASEATKVLVCTDVAARGLHIEDVSYVYNYDIPIEPKDYVHRIGRTARAGDSGMAVNILCEYDYDNFSRLQREYNEFTIGSQEIPKLMPIQMVRVAPNRGGPRRFGSNRGSGRGGFGRGPRRGPGRSNFSRGSPDSRKPFYAGARRNFRK